MFILAHKRICEKSYSLPNSVKSDSSYKNFLQITKRTPIRKIILTNLWLDHISTDYFYLFFRAQPNFSIIIATFQIPLQLVPLGEG
jgi:hypothetical protein